MPLIRPEVTEALVRWREVILGVAIVVFGLWLFNLGGVFYPVVGFFAGLLGVGLAIAAWRRMRFPGGGGGLGVVEVDERQITYFAPQGGGAVSIDTLARVEIHTNNAGPFQPDLFWVFHSDGEPMLTIPGGAKGIEALFDALSALPGANYAAATEAAGSTEQALFVIWQKERSRLH
ncbi:hypothetical protein ACMU_03920 [Actibacterium mucosum KCTC 23349]|uniref:Uncharacterized protein n=1 Tax=Actibacterium mucosum KCTC 23349 TaxID=1454373 RepID=A0A037ZGW8_9RHOB|nr:hypothetical protein [Actibacterium mucosum]KAJ54050.1 hypothetical protein ACMU_03920 [Actibacterium mucosum KCTC 23349]